MRYREEAKQRSCAKKKSNMRILRETSLLRFFAVKVFGCGQAALGVLGGE